MPKQRAGDAETTRAAVVKVAGWLNDGTAPEPDRAEIAAAVRLTARALAALAPGASVVSVVTSAGCAIAVPQAASNALHVKSCKPFISILPA